METKKRWDWQLMRHGRRPVSLKQSNSPSKMKHKENQKKGKDHHQQQNPPELQ